MALEYRSCHWPGGSAGSPQRVRPMGCWFFPVPRPPYVCAVSWAAWLLLTGVPARCVALRLRCPGPLGPCSAVRPLGALLCLCGVLGHLAPVYRCARMVCRVACAVSWAAWLLFTGAPARCVVLCVGCPGPHGSCSPVCPLGVLLCVCGLLGHLAPVHRCAWPCCPVPLLSSVLVRVRCAGPGGACSPVCALCAVCVCLGKFLVNVVFTHCIFLNEGPAIFLQLIGFAMGTNCAPSWAQLVLRAYERCSPLPRDILFCRYIDDGFAVHPLSLSVQDLNTHLCKVYPKHLAFTFVDKASRCGIAFFGHMGGITRPPTHKCLLEAVACMHLHSLAFECAPTH